MALADEVILLAGLMELVLPGGTVRISEGGMVVWGSDTYDAEDDVFGSIGSVEAVSEGLSDEAPGGRLTLIPPDLAEAADLFQPEAQGSPLRFWLAEVDPATGEVDGDPELLFDGLVDTLKVRHARNAREVEIEFMSAAERLFAVREGNVLSPRFHQSIWAGELGLDYATGATLAVPWGTTGPPRGTVYGGTGGSSGGSGGGGGGIFGGAFDNRVA